MSSDTTNVPSPTTGTVDFIVGDHTYKTWYMVYGKLVSEGKTPLVVVHGGPGMSHHYMLPNKFFYEKYDIPVIFYDQIGNGASSHVHDAPPEFWIPELFMDQLDSLLISLGITGNFDLLGNSWGGMLVGHYAAARVPKGLRRLIIANAPSSVELFEQGTQALLDQFPGDFGVMMRTHEKNGTTDSEEFQKGLSAYQKKHICAMDPWPKELLDSFAEIEKDPTVYSTMWGTSEWNVTGTMKGWSVIDIVKNITAPTLLLSAPLDEVQEISVLPWFTGIPKIKWVRFENSTHLAQFEEPERYFEVIYEFLRD